MDASPVEHLRNSLMTTREEADRMLLEAQEQAARLSRLAADTDRALVDARMDRLNRLRMQADAQHREVSGAYAGMAEAMAGVAGRLVTIAREADFSIPPWPDGIRHTIEVKLSETQTRELTVRIATEPPRWGGG
jgi:hypothetical protein